MISSLVSRRGKPAESFYKKTTGWTPLEEWIGFQLITETPKLIHSCVNPYNRLQALPTPMSSKLSA